MEVGVAFSEKCLLPSPPPASAASARAMAAEQHAEEQNPRIRWACEALLAYLCCFDLGMPERNEPARAAPATAHREESSRLLHQHARPENSSSTAAPMVASTKRATAEAGMQARRSAEPPPSLPRPRNPHSAPGSDSSKTTTSAAPTSHSVDAKVSSVRSLLADEDECCAACLEEYDDENPRIHLVCSHEFHLGCILQWAERSCTCPICERDLSDNKHLPL